MILIVASFALPAVLLLAGAGGLQDLRNHPGLFVANWAYMFAPQLLVLVVALLVRASRSHFMTWALAALNLALIGFQCWVWLAVSGRDAPFAWILYPPLCGLLLLAVAGAAHLRTKKLLR